MLFKFVRRWSDPYGYTDDLATDGWTLAGCTGWERDDPFLCDEWVDKLFTPVDDSITIEVLNAEMEPLLSLNKDYHHARIRIVSGYNSGDGWVPFERREEDDIFIDNSNNRVAFVSETTDLIIQGVFGDDAGSVGRGDEFHILFRQVK